MNKATKGAIAAGAAGILLLGGAGTFALWEDQVDIDAGTVSTGTLTLTVDALNAEWTETLTPGVEIDPTTFEIVPGDSLTYTTKVSVQATGTNLNGELKISEDSYMTELALTPVPDVTVTVDHTAVSIPDLLTVVGNEMTFVERATPYEFDVTITVAFADVQSQSLANRGESINLDDLELIIEQKS